MIKVQGHRGYPDAYPENTLLSFRETYKTGCQGIELDVRKSSDGVFVIMHDPAVDRTTNGAGSVADLTWSYLSTLDAGGWFSSYFQGRSDCKVPRLVDVLDEFRGLDVTLVIHTAWDFVGITDVIDLVTARGMRAQVQIFSGIDVINPAKLYDPTIFTMNAGMPGINDYQTYLDNAVLNGHDAVSIHAGSSDEDLATMAQAIQGAGKLVHLSYLAQTYGDRINKFISLGCDYVLSNNPELMENYVQDYYGLSPATVKLDTYRQVGGERIKTHQHTETPDGVIRLDAYTKI